MSTLEQSDFSSGGSIYTSIKQTESTSSDPSHNTAVPSAGAYAETIRLPITVKEENRDDDDVMLIEGPNSASVVSTSDSVVDISHTGMQDDLNTSLSDGQTFGGGNTSLSGDMKVLLVFIFFVF